MELSRLTRDGTTKPVSRDQILRHAGDRAILFSLFSWPRAGLATLPGWFILAICDDHIYIHTYIHTYMHTYIHTFIHKYIHTYIVERMCYLECMLPFPFFLLPDTVEGVIFLLKRVFGVKGHDVSFRVRLSGRYDLGRHGSFLWRMVVVRTACCVELQRTSSVLYDYLVYWHKRGRKARCTGEWCDSTIVWVKMFHLFVIRGCYLLFTM